MPSLNEITVTQLARLIGTPAAPVIIDVRIEEDFADEPNLIPTAIRHPHHVIASLAPQLVGQNVVVYCQQGKKLSQGAAALLRYHRIAAESLQGGYFAWRDCAEMLVPAVKIPRANPAESSLWVTRHRPKIDRMACPWLIRRFVDRDARFLFVAPGEVLSVAEKFDATPFDIDGVFWSHRGDKCTFDTMLDEFGLISEPLSRLAVIVRGADTNRHDLAPEVAGLLAASLGLSRMFRDDIEQIEAGMGLYDAFYRWSRDAQEESHDWPQPGVGA